MAFLRKGILLFWVMGIVCAGINIPHRVEAAHRTAVQNGNWTNANTWGGVVPSNLDTVTIPEGIIVSIPSAVVVNRDATTTVEGILENNGALIITASFNNYGTFNNYAPNGYVGNSGTFTNMINTSAIWFNADTFLNSSGGYLQNSVGASMTNAGDLTNYSYFTNLGTFTNGGAVENWVDTQNNGTITNNGSFINRCGGVYSGNAPTGNAIVVVLPAPAPGLVNPSHKAHTTDTTPSFAWNGVTNGYSYRIMVYTEDRSFEYKKRVFATNYTLKTGEALTVNKYLWRVRTQDSYCTTWSGWSGRYTLFVD